MKKILLITLLLSSGFLQTPVHAAPRNITIYGKVNDEITGRPVDGVKIIIEPSDKPAEPAPVTRPLTPGTTDTLTPGSTKQLSAPVKEEPIAFYTDLNGNYRISISSGEYTLEFRKKDYQKQVRKVSLKRGRSKLNVKMLNFATYLAKEIVVKAREPVYKKPSVSRETLTRKEIKKIAGPKEDIFDAVKILPGLAIADDYSAEFAIRGGDPDETGVYLDNSKVLSPFHMEATGEGISGGLVTVFNNDMIENVTLYTGGFPARFGDAMSGVLEIETRNAGEGELEGKLGLSLIDARFYFNLPISDKFGISVAGRRNYMDLLLGMLTGGSSPGGEHVEAETADFIFPSFWDLHLKLDWEIGKKDNLSFYVLPTGNFASIDFEGVVDYPEDMPLIGGKTSSYTSTMKWDTRGILAYSLWEHEFSEKLSSLFTLSYNQKEYDIISQIVSTEPEIDLDAYQKILGRNLEVNSELLYSPVESHNIRCGVSFKPTLVTVDAKNPEPDPFKFVVNHDTETDHYEFIIPYTTTTLHLASYYASAYIQDRWEVADRLYADFGLRLDYLEWNMGSYSNSLLSPRLGISYGITQKITARTAWGYFYQHPSIEDFLPEYGGHTGLTALKAEHLIVSIEGELPFNTSLKLEGYVKDYDNLISVSTTELADIEDAAEKDIYKKYNEGEGYAMGVEFMIKNKLSERFSAWLSYTLSSAMKKEHGDDKYYYFDYDRTHILTTNISCQPIRRLEVGISWKWFSGKPYTPRTRKDEDAGGYYESKRGEKNSLRTPPYNRVDLRVSRKFMFSKWHLTAYLEMINIFNKLNVSSYHWNSIEGKQEASYMLPFIPFFGLEAKF